MYQPIGSTINFVIKRRKLKFTSQQKKGITEMKKLILFLKHRLKLLFLWLGWLFFDTEPYACTFEAYLYKLKKDKDNLLTP